MCAVTPGVMALVIAPEVLALPLLYATAAPSSLLPSGGSSTPSHLGSLTLMNETAFLTSLVWGRALL